jgi:hypothetical protein
MAAMAILSLRRLTAKSPAKPGLDRSPKRLLQSVFMGCAEGYFEYILFN